MKIPRPLRAAKWLPFFISSRRPAKPFSRGCSPITSKDIVLLGDSIFEFCEWSELLPFPVKNRGVRGEMTHQVLARARGMPQAAIVFIEVGLNDVDKGIPNREIESNYIAILEALQPAKLCVIGIPTPCPERPINRPIEALNFRLSCITGLRGHGFIPLPPSSPETTTDGVHPNTKGYQLMAALIQHHLKTV